MNIVFQDDQILVIDKPTGLVTNRSQTVKEKTLQDQLTQYFNLGDRLGIGDRAGIVHRLDRETSGLLIIAKTQKAFEFLQNQFANRQVKKEYTALVHGFVEKEKGEISTQIGRIGKFGKFGQVAQGKQSQTDYQSTQKYQLKDDFLKKSINNLVEKSNINKSRVRYLNQHAQGYTLLKIFPKTGRTHQIRVHLKLLHHPVVSDSIYTPGKLLKLDLLWCPRLFLHASYISFIHPKSKKQIEFALSLPNDLKNAMLNLLITNN